MVHSARRPSTEENDVRIRRVAAGLTAAVGFVTLTAVPLNGQSAPPKAATGPSTPTAQRPSAPPTAAQGPSTSPKAAAAKRLLRTPWGDPDLQGVWSYATTTPLQRPAAAGDRVFLTDEEVAKQNAETDPLQAEQVRPAPAGDPGTYNRVWFDTGGAALNRRTSLIVDPPNGRLPPLTPEAQKRFAARREYLRQHPADSWLDRSGTDRCLVYHGAPPISTGYGNNLQIFQAPGYVAILHEQVHDVRMVPLDGRARLNVPRWSGESRGHWEGNTLVVETTNYSEKAELSPGSPLRFPASTKTRAIERFTRVNADRIDYSFTIDDPSVYTRAWTAERPMPRLPDEVLYEYACHEGNQAMEGILAGARAEEAAAAQKATGASPK
jgi:hypothetical protein